MFQWKFLQEMHFFVPKVQGPYKTYFLISLPHISSRLSEAKIPASFLLIYGNFTKFQIIFDPFITLDFMPG